MRLIAYMKPYAHWVIFALLLVLVREWLFLVIG